MNNHYNNRSKLITGIVVAVILLAAVFIIGIAIGRSTANRKAVDEVADAAESFVDDKIIGHEGKIVEVKSRANLEDVIRISQLRTMTYKYDSIAKVTEGDRPLYYIAYKGTVVLGIEAKDIKLNIDWNTNQINIILPEVKVMETNVDAASLDFMIIDEFYDIPSITTTAQHTCIADLKEKLPQDSIMFDLAKETTLNEVKAMVNPIISQFYGQFKVTIDFADKEGEG